MPIKIYHGDMVIEVDGEEAARVLEHVGALPSGERTTVRQFIASGQKEEDINRFRRMYRALGQKPREVLHALLENNDGLTDVELKVLLVPKGITTLAGSMTGISKGIKTAGLDQKKVLIREKQRNRETGAYFHYQLGPVAREFLLAEQRLKLNGKTVTNASK